MAAPLSASVPHAVGSPTCTPADLEFGRALGKHSTVGDVPGPWGRRLSSSGNGRRWWLALVLGVVALVVYLTWRFPDALSSRGHWLRVFYLVALLALVSSAVLVGRRLPLKVVAKQMATWIAVGLVLVVGYTYRIELGVMGERVVGELLPHRGSQVSERVIAFRAGIDGHFRIEALVDGTAVRFLVDTGASRVVLSPADARRLDFDPTAIAFSETFSTANGRVRAAPVLLGRLVIGPIEMTDLPASINEVEMESSLLGMSFLERLQSYEVRGGTLTLRW